MIHKATRKDSVFWAFLPYTAYVSIFLPGGGALVGALSLMWDAQWQKENGPDLYACAITRGVLSALCFAAAGVFIGVQIGWRDDEEQP